MKRKIVQHGSTSLTVTLPHGWVTQCGLKRGDELSCEAVGSRITFSATASPEEKKKEVNISEFGIFTKNNLTHLYQLGYDDITIWHAGDGSLREIKERIGECIGFEIIDMDDKRVYIKSIAHTLEADFEIMLRKSFLITKQMACDIHRLIKAKEYSKLKDIRQLESMNNKFTMACVRILNRQGHEKQERIMQMYDLIKQLERICDELKYICDALSGCTGGKQTASGKVLDYFLAVRDYYETFYSLYYKFTTEGKKKIYLRRKELLASGAAFIETAKGKESLLIHHLMNMVDKTYDAAGEYFAIQL